MPNRSAIKVAERQQRHGSRGMGGADGTRRLLACDWQHGGVVSSISVDIAGSLSDRRAGVPRSAGRSLEGKALPVVTADAGAWWHASRAWGRAASAGGIPIAAAVLAYAGVSLGLEPGCLTVASLIAILAPPLFLTIAHWVPLATAIAVLTGWWLAGGASPDLSVPIGMLLAAGTASAGSSIQLARERRRVSFVERLESDVAVLSATNESMRESSEVAEAVLAATRDISPAVEAGEVAVRVARNACAATQGLAAAVLLWDQEREVFRIAAVAGGGGSGAEVQQLEVSLRGAAPLQNALGEGMADVARSAIHDPVLDALMRRWQASALLAARLQRGDRLLGLVISARRSVAPASSKVCQILSGIALQATAALEIANLVNDLRTASNLKEEFMATMSHELRTPLNVIIGYTDLQREGAFGDLSPDHLDTLDRIREQSLQLLDLIQATLDVGRLERGLMTVDVRDLEVSELVENLMHGLPASWRKPGVDLRWRVDAAVPVIRSDPAKLQVMLRNLVHNALKFTDTGQVTLSVTCDSERRRVHFVVQDSGIGIPARDLSAIFEMFRQSSDRDPSVGGVGLGLYIVKRMVGLLGGEIDVRSTPGRGATFRIHLPTGGPHVPPSQVGPSLGSRVVRVAM
jgi:signal transduction histidine kinase